ncbi:MAG: RNA polymerase sigma factor [Gaiellales bacterium]
MEHQAVADPGTSDAQLLARIDDPRAFEVFYRRHLQALLRFATRRCTSPEEAAELVSMVFLEVRTSAHGYDPHRGAARAWLVGIAMHCLADLHGRRMRADAAERRLGGMARLDADEHAEVEARIDAERLYPQLQRALARLSTGDRDMLELVDREGLTPSEAALALGIRPVTARVRLLRARRRLLVDVAERSEQPVARRVM